MHLVYRLYFFHVEVYMVLVIAIAFVLAVAIITTGIVCLYRYVCNFVQVKPSPSLNKNCIRQLIQNNPNFTDNDMISLLNVRLIIYHWL